MKPILIATPRSGSTVICKQISNLAEQWWGYKGCVNELFHVGSWFQTEVVKVNGILNWRVVGPVTQSGGWCEDIAGERARRRELLENRAEYMINLHANVFENWTVDWVKQNWDPVFLERRNTVDQIISYAAYRTSKKAHYAIESNAVVNEFIYCKEHADLLLDILEKYHQIKKQLPGPTLYYEDWLSEGGDQNAIIKLLGWPNKPYMPEPSRTKPTPYVADPERLIVNSADWDRDKHSIVSRLNNFSINN